MSFAEVVTNALQHFDAEFLANRFQVSESTVNRWASGDSVPMAFMEKKVRNEIEALSGQTFYEINADDS